MDKAAKKKERRTETEQRPPCVLCNGRPSAQLVTVARSGNGRTDTSLHSPLSISCFCFFPLSFFSLPAASALRLAGPMTFLVGRNHQWLHHHHHRRHLKRPHLRADTALEQAATLLFASAPVHISPCCLFPTWHTFTYAKHKNISSFSSSFSIFFSPLAQQQKDTSFALGSRRAQTTTG